MSKPLQPPDADAVVLRQAMQFVAAALAIPANGQILRRLPMVSLPDAWLVAGCLFQAVWNNQSDRTACAGVKDYDLFYYDDRDLSWAAEDEAIGFAHAVLTDVPVTCDIKNQARVHLWYEQRFGSPYLRLQNTRGGIDRFLVAGTCVGLSTNADGTLKLYAPFGLDDIFDGLLRPNPLMPDAAAFLAKAATYQARWPHLRIEMTMREMVPQHRHHMTISADAAFATKGARVIR